MNTFPLKIDKSKKSYSSIGEAMEHQLLKSSSIQDLKKKSKVN